MICANLFMPRIPRIVYVPEPFFAIFIIIPFTITGMYIIFSYFYFIYLKLMFYESFITFLKNTYVCLSKCKQITDEIMLIFTGMKPEI